MSITEDSTTRWPTKYPEINAILRELLSGARGILGEQFVGMYLYGSLALDDFSLLTSDIDFLIATREEITPTELAALQAMHMRIGAIESKWANQLEGAYLSLASLRRHETPRALHPHIDRDGSDLIVRPFESDWVVQRYVLREQGITITGPDIRDLIDPVTPGMLRAAVMDLLQIWWEPMLHNPSELQKPGYRHYAILTMCRMLYSLETGTVASKPAAGRWAEERLPDAFRNLVVGARQWTGAGAPGTVEETQAIIRYTVERSKALLND